MFLKSAAQQTAFSFLANAVTEGPYWKSEMKRPSSRFPQVVHRLGLSATLAVGLLAAQNAAIAEEGDPYVAHYMWRRYFNTTPNCPTEGTTPNAATAPEFACTGVIFRATSPTREQDGAWIPEAKSYANSGKRAAGGVSFSYIRADSKFERAAWNATNGFTIFPNEGKYRAPPDKMKLWVLCAFAIDGSTDNRDAGGCNETNRTKPPSAGYCQTHDVNTLQQWQASFGPPTKTDEEAEKWGWTHQCSFSMQRNLRKPTDFTTVLQAKQYTKTFNTVNELRIQTWAANPEEGKSKSTALKFPIESFFYFVGKNMAAPDSATGKSNAQSDQKKYYNLTGVFVPIVRIKLPATPADDFDFSYQKEDQAPGIPIPAYRKSDEIKCTEGHFDTKC